MIRNILFDMGGVLILWDPKEYMNRYGPEDEQEQKRLMRETYHSINWVKQDRGIVSEEDTIREAKKHLPAHLHPYLKNIVVNWTEKRTEIDGMYDLCVALKEKGYTLYLLTNASKRHPDYFFKTRYASLFKDHIFLSADYHLVKPEPAYFEKAMEVFSLKKEECLFIDDSPANVEAAQYLGIDGFVFYNDVSRLKEEMTEKGIVL